MASPYHPEIVTQVAPLEHSRQRQEEFIKDDYRRSFNDPDSFAYGAVRINDTVGQVIVNAAAGNMSRAKEIYQGLNQFIADHPDDIRRAAFLGPTTDPVLHAMQQAATNMVNREFDKKPVTLTDGSQSTVGELFRDGGLYETRRQQEMRNATFNDRTVAVMNGDDEEMKRVVGAFVNPLTGTAGARAQGASIDPNVAAVRGQYVEMGNLLAEKGREFIDGLGTEAIGLLGNHVRSHYMENGTATMMFDTLYRVAKARMDNGAETDPVIAAKGAAQAFDSMKKRVSASNDPDVQRFFATVVMNAVAADPTLDLNSLGVQLGMSRLANMFAADTRAGVPLMAALHNGGAQFGKAAAEFVQYTADGLDVPRDNMIIQLENSMQSLFQLLTPGWSPAAPAPADPKAGAGEASGVFQRSSGHPGLDAATVEVYRVLRDLTVEQIARGAPGQDALGTVLTDPGTVSKVAQTLASSASPVKLTPDAALGIAQQFFGRIVREGTTPSTLVTGIGGLEQAVEEFALADKVQGEPDSVRNARKSARRWLAANIGKMARGLDMLVDQILDPILYDPVNGIGATKDGAVQAARLRESIKKGALALIDAGEDPREFIRSHGGIGRYYTIGSFRGLDGKFVASLPKGANPADYTPQIVEVIGRLDDAEQPYQGVQIEGVGPIPSWSKNAWSDPQRKQMFKTFQTYLKELYKGQVAAARKALERNATSGE